MKYQVSVSVMCIVDADNEDDAHDKALLAVMCKNRFDSLPDCIQCADAAVTNEIKEGAEHENNAE